MLEQRATRLKLAMEMCDTWGSSPPWRMDLNARAFRCFSQRFPYFAADKALANVKFAVGYSNK